MVVALIVPLAVEQLYKYTNYRSDISVEFPCGLWAVFVARALVMTLITSENGSIQISFQRVYDV